LSMMKRSIGERYTVILANKSGMEPKESSILDKIDSPRDLRLVPQSELGCLAEEIRRLIIETTSRTGGHLASSLGAVELAIAIHRALDTPEDRVIWDVGHQAYAHKILTGRRERFDTLRHYGGLSGFPRREESEFDTVDSGHSGSSLSYAMGLALARDLKGEKYSVAAVIGDGAMTSGVAYEAMNQAGHHPDTPMIIILNDNEMSISQNVGGIASYLSRLRIKPGYTHVKGEFEDIIRTMPGLGGGLLKLFTQVKDSVTHVLVPGMLFESFGLKYVGPIDGHDIPALEETIREASEINGPVLVHAVTQKGRGYDFSERRPEKFHGISAFDSTTGKTSKKSGEVAYTERFSDTIVLLGEEKPDLVAITAAMKLGTGLDAFSRRFPRRFFDVGIAEQFAVNLAAAFALGGLRPVVAIYSTFLQRALDQISQEVCLQGLPVVFVIDRAGLVGEDGSTHHGYFDISYTRMLPNMTVMAPGDGDELARMLRFALDLNSPVAVRFPRGRATLVDGVGREPLVAGRGEVVAEGSDIALLAIGDMVEVAVRVRQILKEKGISAAVANARFAKPMDPDFLTGIAGGKKLVVTLEDNVVAGGYGSGVLEVLGGAMPGTTVIVRGLPDRYVHHGKIGELLEESGLSAAKLSEEIAGYLDRA
jgi:1-deoxy-D-xylulose-5-phosphate synthase